MPGACAVVVAACLSTLTWACENDSSSSGADKPTPQTPPSQETKPGKGARISENGVRLISEELYVAFPPMGKITPQREPDIDQAKLLASAYPLYVVLEAGQNLFNNPFEVANGHGEGRNGARSLQRAYWNPRGKTQGQSAWPFLRVNGIDSQSCFECHNTIGEYVPPGARTVAEVRKPGNQGGPAGVASSAFINDQFPEYEGQPNTVLTKFVRNPPVVFGTGYTQRLAGEMTVELQARAESARLAGIRSPNTPQSITLTSKGVDFGTFATTCTGKTIDTCVDDTSNVVGVQADLVIRPFQWGGISSTVRHFARDALDFHFSVQAVEKVGHKDCDLDGLSDEITVGNVSALTAYVTMFRPPNQVILPDKKSSVARGRQVLEEIGCTDCHRASLTIESPILTIMTPPPVSESTPCPQEVSSLLNPDAPGTSDSAEEARARIADQLDEAEVQSVAATGSATPQQIFEAISVGLHRARTGNLSQGNYQIDLSLRNVAPGDVPAYALPRLPAKADSSIDVPLFSDLKIHYMGKELSDDFSQPTDTAGYSAQPGHYVTRVLWGIKDTDPYLHDGRARDLREAIELHGAEGSEAQPAAARFDDLSASDQQALIDFLESLRLPIAPGVAEPEYASK